MKPFHRDLLAAVDRLGVDDARIVHRGEPHPRLIVTIGPRVLRLPIAGSTCNRFAVHNTVALVRREIDQHVVGRGSHLLPVVD